MVSEHFSTATQKIFSSVHLLQYLFFKNKSEQTEQCSTDPQYPCKNNKRIYRIYEKNLPISNENISWLHDILLVAISGQAGHM
jgi:hypothetical protein